MLVDSHCHLTFPELSSNLTSYLQQMHSNEVDFALVIATNLAEIKRVLELVEANANLFAAIGVHPDEKEENLSANDLAIHLHNPKVIALGETGLDYYWHKDQDLSWQHQRFLLHIELAKKWQLPLIVHMRDAANDTWQILKEAQLNTGAVIHCFTENVSWAKKFLDLDCYISLSGIVTFKNALKIQEVAKYVPLERLLLETDAPYLAPMPYRGKLNHPALVRHTAEYVAALRNITLACLAKASSDNFFNLFTKARVFR